MASLLNNFNANVQLRTAGRFTASGVNADDLGLTLVIGIPMAWYLIRYGRGMVRIIASVYFALAPLSILLTGTRGAFVAGIIALSIVPLTLARPSLRSFVVATVSLLLITGATAVMVPRASWTRILSIPSEVLEGGSMTGRKYIWEAGLKVFPEHPFLGFGAGAYGPAVGQLLNTDRTVSHNVPLAVLVELGIVGCCLFAAFLGSCASVILRLPPPDRKLWAVVMTSWLVGVMSVNWEYRKVTWLLFALLAARGGERIAHRENVESQRGWKYAGARAALARRRTTVQAALQHGLRLTATVQRKRSSIGDESTLLPPRAGRL
jgi:O-antigen ligase